MAGALRARVRAARARLGAARGATAVEYAILAGAIAAVIVVAVFLLGQATNEDFDCAGRSWRALSNQC